ncbi:MAG: TAXI family TRAP transporter solute-binding subunit [Dialister sp.]|nr:TAXI family TRAP transporter solute-binding subunit [Dialister sp.]
MKKVWSVMLICAGLLLSGCQKDGQIRINFPTGNAQGSLYSTGAAITRLWSTEVPRARAASQASAGGIANLAMVSDGEAQVSVAIASNVWECREGKGSFAGYKDEQICVIAGLYMNPNQLVVRKGAGIENLSDARGRRIAVASAGSSVYDECRTHFTQAGLDFPSDLKAEYISFGDAADLLRSGRIDGAWIMAGVPAAAVTEAASSGAELLSLSPEFVADMTAAYPWYAAYTIPAGTYPGQERAVLTTAVKMVMFTRRDMDDELVYRLTKTFWEHIQELGETQKPLRGLLPKDGVTNIAGIPLHPGAEKYYREIGVLP